MIREIVQAGFRFDKLCWARAKEFDIEESAKTGANRINISFRFPMFNFQRWGEILIGF